ncbi:ABC transporter permease [Pseudoflavonifractor sp. An85]|uniref:ABC transporter permease n=1 Tax=Pseudoflavonifractor sp. An85 TaxID=1965661 RepID=UPI000B3997DD|nr:ABC transporter permease [Pseudoflavonifractor sp. An85]OUN25603.1 nickel ABC transporter permease subunit NikB [Pseudoflavonifractor sp. An85]
MRGYVCGRLARLIPILLVITFVCFGLMRLAGSDAVEQRMENTGTVLAPEVVERAKEELGLDKPFLTQYGVWLWGLLHGDMGTSYVSGREVLPTFLEKLPATLGLTAVSLFLTVLISIPLGVVAAVRQNRWTDYLLRGMSFVGNSLPNFLVALLLLYFFAVRWKVFPVMSRDAGLGGVVLPSLTLAIAMSAKYLRQVRAAVLEELSQDYVVGAAARGVPFGVTLVRSVLRGALVPLVTLLALSVGSLLGGTAIVESIFLWDGVGKLAVDAIQMRDYPVILAYVMWMSILYVVVNLVADLCCRAFNPRIRLGGERP